MDLALQGLLTIIAFLALILVVRVPVIVALILVPVVAALAGGHGETIGAMSVDGLKIVAPVIVLMTFAILYFGLMIDAGLFEPLVRGLIRLVRNDPVRLCIVTAFLPMLVALDGDGATTFLISITALLPIHRRMEIRPLVLPTIVGLSAGVMNLLPWGGPTARAMTVLNADFDQIFLPILPAMLAGTLWVLGVAAFMGFRERRRRIEVSTPMDNSAFAQGMELDLPGNSTSGIRLYWFNLLLTFVLLVLLFQDIYASLVTLPKMSAALLFMAAFAIALPVNRRTLKAQQEQIASHAPNVVTVVAMVAAGGVFTGILNGSGMIGALAQAMATAMPSSATPWLSYIVAVTSMPLSLVLTPDAYYFGVLPVFAHVAETLGNDPHAIGRAALMGQMTTGFPLSPLTPSTFILIGLAEVTLRDHQRHMFLWAFGTTIVMTLTAAACGAL